MKQLFFAALLLTALNISGQVPDKLTPAEKVFGLSKFWQEVNYNFVYLDKVDREMWDNRFKELVPIIQATKNDYEYYRELQKFCALLKDGHTNIYLPEEIRKKEMTSMFGEYRLLIENIDNKAIIVRTNLSKKDEIPAGSEIIEVNGKPTQKYIAEDVAPYISSSTDYVLQDMAISGMFRGMEGDTYKVKIRKPDNQVIQLTLTHKLTEEKEIFPPIEQTWKLFDFKWLNNQVAYMQLNSFNDPKIDTLFLEKLPELYRAKGLIIDLRYNGGGNTSIGTEILKYLTYDSVMQGSKSSTRQHISAYKAWGNYFSPKDTLQDKPEWGMSQEKLSKAYLMSKDKYYYHFPSQPDTFKVNAKRIVIPTVLLIGHNTASAAEDFLIYADRQKHMTRIGANTFGSTGQPLDLNLPGGGSARVCTKKDTYPDGREFVGYGIKPDIEVKLTLSDYLNKKDPVLDKAMEFLKQKLK